MQRLIEVTEVARHRPRKENGIEKSKTFKYFVLVVDTRHEVCKNAYLNLHGTTDKRIRRIRSLLVAGKSPHDRRGSNIKGNTMPADEIVKLREHIDSFPVKQSHYSGKEFKYLDAKLNVKIMYTLYKEMYPNTRVKYDFYIKYFRENYSLSFGRPQVDTCCSCEELSVKIKSPSLNEAAKRIAVAELLVHKRRSKKFYTALNMSTEQSKGNEDVLGICFDFMQNLQLPQIPVQEIFYLRQLTVNVFGIHNLKTGNAVFYVYHEGLGRKGPNEVCSFILDYIEEFVPENIRVLQLFCDNCPGQNKNHTLIRMCRALVDSGRFAKVENFFPMRGHSFLPCDRDFGVIKRKLKKTDRIYSVYEYVEQIILSSQKGNFVVKLVEASDILDFKTWWPAIYKKNVTSIETSRKEGPRSEKFMFNISKFHYFLHTTEKPGVVTAAPFIAGCMSHNFVLRVPGQRKPSMPNKKAYENINMMVPINTNKIQDLRKVASYIPEEWKTFYEEIYNWPTDANQVEND